MLVNRPILSASFICDFYHIQFKWDLAFHSDPIFPDRSGPWVVGCFPMSLEGIDARPSNFLKIDKKVGSLFVNRLSKQQFQIQDPIPSCD